MYVHQGFRERREQVAVQSRGCFGHCYIASILGSKLRSLVCSMNSELQTERWVCIFAAVVDILFLELVISDL